MKHRNLTPLAAAVAAVLGAGSAQAFDIPNYATAQKVYFGGATATDNTLEFVFLAASAGLCDQNSAISADARAIDVYRAANQRVVTCTLTQESTGSTQFATRAAGGTKVAFHKESAGGSSNGVNPLINVATGAAHALRWLKVDDLTAPCATVTAVAATGALQAYTDHSGCSLALTPADTAGDSTYDVNGGISDNEPALAFPKPTQANINRLQSVPGVQIIFGLPVTTKVYRALQQVQFTDADCLSDTNAALDADSRDLPKCVPSLEKNQVSGLYSGRLSNWNSLRDSTGTGLANSALVTDAPRDPTVYMCRRVAASGTQATAEALGLNQRCASGGFSFVLPDDGSSVSDSAKPAGTPDFVNGTRNAGPSSTNVRDCLTYANGLDLWAVGVHSTEVTPAQYGLAVTGVSPAGGNGFRFVAINGASPNLVNVANGSYDFFSENTVNRIRSPNPGALPAGPRLQTVIEVSEKLGQVDSLATINASFATMPTGLGGVLALPSVANPNTPPFTAAQLALKPISTQTRAGNTCNLPNIGRPQAADNR